MKHEGHPLLLDFIRYMEIEKKFSTSTKMRRILTENRYFDPKSNSSYKLGVKMFDDVKHLMARGGGCAKVPSGGCCSPNGYEATNCFVPLQESHFRIREMFQIISQQLAELAEEDECPVCFEEMTTETKFEFHRHLRTGDQAPHLACNKCYKTLVECPICRQAK